MSVVVLQAPSASPDQAYVRKLAPRLLIQANDSVEPSTLQRGPLLSASQSPPSLGAMTDKYGGAQKRRSPSPDHQNMRPPPALRSPMTAPIKAEPRPESATETRAKARAASASSGWSDLPSLGSVLSSHKEIVAGSISGPVKSSAWQPSTRASHSGPILSAPIKSLSSVRNESSPNSVNKDLPPRPSGLATLAELDRGRAMAARDAAATTSYPVHRGPARNSPPPRLPGFASLQSPVTEVPSSFHPRSSRRAPPPQQQHMVMDSRRVSTASRASSLSEHSSQLGGVEGAPPGPRTHLSAFPAPPYGEPSSVVLAASASPTPHGTFFSQPPIHPALLGLPGAGGGPGSKQQPSFVCKLYTILEDEKIQHMISWIADGSAFRVASPSEFSRIVLPTYFKHANWQSFVRQLNMYGFHKVTNSSASPDDPQSQVWEFRHPNFRRGEIHLLSDIKRKSSRHPKQHQQQSHHTSLANRDSPEHDNSSNTSAEGMAASGAVQGHDGYMRSGDDADSISTPAFDGRSRLDSYAESAAEGYARGPETGAMPIHASPHAAFARDVSAVRHCEARVDDLSDRIDAIIRHSSYLESQLRYVSEQLRVSQHSERLVRKHSLEALGRLSGFCVSLHRGGDREYNVHEYRSGLLEAIQREIEQLHSLNALTADQ